jgi:hypothetical protein
MPLLYTIKVFHSAFSETFIKVENYIPKCYQFTGIEQALPKRIMKAVN